MPKPTPKMNLVHQQILKGLEATKATSWTHKTIDPASEDPKRPNIIKTTVTGTELVNGLARNVSALNIERAVDRWTA